MVCEFDMFIKYIALTIYPFDQVPKFQSWYNFHVYHVVGAVTIYAGLEVAYLGFGCLTAIIGISMIIYFIWIGILGGLMWKKSMSKYNQKI